MGESYLSKLVEEGSHLESVPEGYNPRPSTVSRV